MGEFYEIDADEGKNIPTWRAAYSDRSALLMAKVSYHLYKYDFDQIAKIIKIGGFKILKTYEIGSVKGYLAKSDDFAFLVFRGSVTLNDWKTNFNFELIGVESDIGNIKIHSGFWETYQKFADELKNDVDTLIGDKIGLYTAGHSLGGALAQIASATLRLDNLAACYTFGCPRVGNDKFDEFVKCPHYRIVNGWDLVPTIPWAMWGGYQQSGDARILTKLGNSPQRRTTSNVIEIARQIFGLITFWLGSKNPLILDHQMSEYIAKLRAIVSKRN